MRQISRASPPTTHGTTIATIFQSSIIPGAGVFEPPAGVEAAWVDAIHSRKTLATKIKTFVAPIVAS